MKKKINGLANLTEQFIDDKNITFHQFIKLFHPFVRTKHLTPITRRAFEWDALSDCPNKYKNIIVCTLHVKLKKIERKKIKRILSSRQNDNELTFFYHIIYDEDDNLISKHLKFRNNQMYRMRDFKLYDFLYEFRKLLPNLLIDLEMMLYGSL